jgi:hypothetical protein
MNNKIIKEKKAGITNLRICLRAHRLQEAKLGCWVGLVGS